MHVSQAASNNNLFIFSFFLSYLPTDRISRSVCSFLFAPPALLLPSPNESDTARAWTLRFRFTFIITLKTSIAVRVRTMDGTYFNSSLTACPNSNGPCVSTQYHTPSKGLVSSRVNQINAYTRQGQISHRKLGKTPVVSQRRRSGSFAGPIGRPTSFLRHPRLIKYNSSSSLSTTVSSLDLGLCLDGEFSNGLPLGKRDLSLASKGKKLPELSSYASSRLATTLGRTLQGAAQCTPMQALKAGNSQEPLKSSHISIDSATQKLDTGDGVREDFYHREPLHQCHYCGRTMKSRDPCSNCGHEVCPQCIEDETSLELLSTEQSAPQSQGLSGVWSPKHNFPDLNLLRDDYSYPGNPKPQSGYFPEGQIASGDESSSERVVDSSTDPSFEQQSRSTVKAKKRPPMRTAKSTPTLSSSPFTENAVAPSRRVDEELEPSTNSMRSSPHHTLSLNRSCSTGDRTVHHGPRHCFCCAARQPYRTLRTAKSVTPQTRNVNVPMEKMAHRMPDYSLPSPSDRSPSTLLKTPADFDLYPPALQPHRQHSMTPSLTSNKPASPLFKSPSAHSNRVTLPHSQEDPFEGHRRLQPHPHPPEPETEPWPQLRRVTRPIGKRPEVPSEPIPWRRSALRKVPADQTEEAPSPSPTKESLPQLEPHEQLEGANNPPEPLFTSPPQTPNTRPGRRRDTRAFFDRNRSESSKRGGLSAAHSARDPSYSSRGSGVSPRQIDSYQNSRASPQLSLRQVEKMLAQGVGKNEPYSIEGDVPEPNDPDNAQSGTVASPPMNGSPTRHSCGWKDRFMDLSAEVDHLKAELASHAGASSDTDTDTARGVATQTTPRQSKQNDSDTGIEGITIVIHLRGKDDLVINTDLRNGQYQNP